MLLDGDRVLDLPRLLPGGYCTQLLQAQGAQVTKIEPPAGDPIRALPGGDAYFDTLHRGQRLVTLDLRTEAGRDALRRLVVDADVLVEGFRPGVMERMDLGYAALAAINPALVYCAITGYGSGGPMAGRAGHDLNYLARSGALSLMPLRAGIPAIPGLQVADLAGPTAGGSASRPPRPPADRRIALLPRLRRGGRIPDLRGARVRLLGGVLPGDRARGPARPAIRSRSGRVCSGDARPGDARRMDGSLWRPGCVRRRS